MTVSAAGSAGSRDEESIGSEQKTLRGDVDGLRKRIKRVRSTAEDASEASRDVGKIGDDVKDLKQRIRDLTKQVNRLK